MHNTRENLVANDGWWKSRKFRELCHFSILHISPLSAVPRSSQTLGSLLRTLVRSCVHRIETILVCTAFCIKINSTDFSLNWSDHSHKSDINWADITHCPAFEKSYKDIMTPSSLGVQANQKIVLNVKPRPDKRKAGVCIKFPLR